MSLPLDAAQVTLTLPDREMLSGRVDVRREDFVEIALLEAPRTPLPTWEEHALYLEWVAAAGVRRQRGHITFLDALPVGDSFGVFDVVRFVPDAEEQLLQRREFVRTRITVGVRLRAAPVAATIRASTLNVGGGGLLVRGPVEGAVGDELHFDLEPLADDGRVIRGRCRVIRLTSDGGLGVQFTEIDEDDRDDIVRFAYKRELAERGRRLAA
jgi:hypothetical protein